MTKIKRTPVPLPGQNPKSLAKPSRAPSKAPLSQEFIESSDDSANEETPRKKAIQKPAKRQATTSIAVHRPKANGVQKKTEKVAPKPAPAPKKIVKEVLETSSSSEESEDEDEGAKSKENIQQQNAGNKADADTSDSASDSDSSSDESDEPAPAPTHSATPTYVRMPSFSLLILTTYQPVQSPTITCSRFPPCASIHPPKRLHHDPHPSTQLLASRQTLRESRRKTNLAHHSSCQHFPRLTQRIGNGQSARRGRSTQTQQHRLRLLGRRKERTSNT